MTYAMIPEPSDIRKALDFSREYNLTWEYNDFTFPEVYDNPEVVDQRIDFYKRMDRDLADDTMHGAFLGLDIAAIDPILRERSRALIEQSADIASCLGLKGVVFHTGLVGGLRLEYYLNHWLEEASAFYTKLCKKYPHLMIYMENSFEQEPDVFVCLMEKMKAVPNFKLCLDYGHAILTATDIEIWVKTLAPYIGHMHLNDNDLKDDLHMVPGTGKIDFHKWKSLIEENKIDTTVLLELRGYEEIQKSVEYMMSIG